jgi:hypothetical protein
MIPGFAPPTDNLYKFLALFGLAILLFSFYKSSEIYEVCTITKSTIEDLRNEIHRAVRNNNNQVNYLSDTADMEANTFSIKHLSSDLHEIDLFVTGSSLSDSVKFELNTSIRKMQIEMDVLETRTKEYYFILGLGIILMFYGFFQWYRKDQIYRDRKMKSGILPEGPSENKLDIEMEER